MQMPSRRAVLTVAACISFLLCAAAAAALVLLLTSPRLASPLADLSTHPWWFVYGDAPRGAAAAKQPFTWVIGAALLCALLGSAAALRAYRSASRTGSGAALFLCAAFFALSVEALRGPAALVIARGSSITAAMVMTRAVYAARFAGQLALLAAGLHALEMKYRRNVVLLGILIVVSLAIGIYIPMDRTAYLASLTFKLGDEQGVWFADLALGILAAASFAGAAFTHRNRSAGIAAGACALLFAGRQMLSFSGPPASLAAGAGLLAAGLTAAITAADRMTPRAGGVKARGTAVMEDDAADPTAP
jgi:hypothetical protein